MDKLKLVNKKKDYYLIINSHDKYIKVFTYAHKVGFIYKRNWYINVNLLTLLQKKGAKLSTNLNRRLLFFLLKNKT